jgi:glyoxylase-like metal-dependent hydrolase (beta-lactamase superfamily II)
MTHHHSDHSAGLRRFAAEGATIVVNEVTADFFIENLREERTVLPDELSINPVDFAIEVVPAGGSFTIPDAVHPVVVYPIASSHAADMMTVYLPTEQLVFQSDLFSPGNPIVGPFVAWGLEYAQALVDLGINVTTVAGGHGQGVVTYDQFRTALGL